MCNFIYPNNVWIRDGRLVVMVSVDILLSVLHQIDEDILLLGSKFLEGRVSNMFTF